MTCSSNWLDWFEHFPEEYLCMILVINLIVEEWHWYNLFLNKIMCTEIYKTLGSDNIHVDDQFNSKTLLKRTMGSCSMGKGMWYGTVGPWAQTGSTTTASHSYCTQSTS